MTEEFGLFDRTSNQSARCHLTFLLNNARVSDMLPSSSTFMNLHHIIKNTWQPITKLQRLPADIPEAQCCKLMSRRAFITE